jgi:cation diffusion facilitator family transporter
MSHQPWEDGLRDRQVARVILVEGSANAAIALLKACVGIATGSMAILGDAVHSLTDLANNIVAWFVMRWSSQPPDDGHPYGHRKFETVAVFLLAMLLSLTAFELALAALRRGTPQIVDSGWAVGGMGIVLATNAGLATWQNRWARRLDSDLLRADSRHTFADVLTTLVAIVGWQAAARGYLWVDTAATLGVALLIGFLAYGLFRRSLPVLVDQASIDPEQLRRAALAVPGVVVVGQVRSRSYGHLAAADLVVGVAPDLSTVMSHEIATRVEHALHDAFPLETVTVHVEPDLGGPAADPVVRRMPPLEAKEEEG